MVVDQCLRRYLIADAHGHVADDARRRSGDGEETELDLLLLNLRLERLEVCVGRALRRVGLLELLLADGAGRIQLVVPLLLLTREGQGGFGRCELSLLARHCRLLSPRVDFHERGALPYPVARHHEDLRDLAVDLRLHGGRFQRPERGDVLAGVLDRRRMSGREHHRCGRHALAWRRSGGPPIARARHRHDGCQRGPPRHRHLLNLLQDRTDVESGAFGPLPSAMANREAFAPPRNSTRRFSAGSADGDSRNGMRRQNRQTTRKFCNGLKPSYCVNYRNSRVSDRMVRLLVGIPLA